MRIGAVIRHTGVGEDSPARTLVYIGNEGEYAKCMYKDNGSIAIASILKKELNDPVFEVVDYCNIESLALSVLG